jgi:hypothetical protein
MADDKLKVSLDEVYSSGVDEKLKSQDAFARTDQHYQQQVSAPGVASLSPNGRSSIWYNAVFYMAVFGLVGGLLSWGVGEAIQQGLRTPMEEFNECRNEVGKLLLASQDGDVSDAKARRLLEGIMDKYKENAYVLINQDTTLSAFQKENARERQLEKDKHALFISNMLWMGLIGVLIALFLSVAESVVTRNWRAIILNGSVAVFLGAIGGIVVSLFIDDLYRAMQGDTGDIGMARQMLARSIGWGILGLFLAIAPGVVMRSWKRLLVGLLGGFLGGLLGGLLFDPIGRWTGSAILSRAVAIVAIGLITALGTGLIERVVKTGWLKVVSGLIAGKQFILYKNPTNIGSSPQCEIYLFKDTQIAPLHAAIHRVPNGYELQDSDSASGTFVNGQTVRKQKLRNGDRIQVGSTVFEFQEKGKQ